MTRFQTLLCSAAAAALLPAMPAFAQDEASDEIVVIAPAAIGAFGVDLTARDTAVKPGDDFEKYASGAWIAKTEIPSDRPSVGAFNNLREDVQAQVQKL